MSSSDDDVIILSAALKKRRRRINRRWWVHPYNALSSTSSCFNVMKEMNEEEKFQSCYRMKRDTFRELCNLLRQHIVKRETNYPPAVSVEEKLLIAENRHFGK